MSRSERNIWKKRTYFGFGLRFVRNGLLLPSNSTIVRENFSKYILAPGDMKGAQDFLKHAIPWLVVGAWFLIYSLVFCNSWTCMYCIAFLCSPPFLFFLGCMRPICQNMSVYFKQLVIKAKIPNILIYCYYSTYLCAGPPCTQGPIVWEFEIKIPTSYPQPTF